MCSLDVNSSLRDTRSHLPLKPPGHVLGLQPRQLGSERVLFAETTVPQGTAQGAWILGPVPVSIIPFVAVCISRQCPAVFFASAPKPETILAFQ